MQLHLQNDDFHVSHSRKHAPRHHASFCARPNRTPDGALVAAYFHTDDEKEDPRLSEIPAVPDLQRIMRMAQDVLFGE